MQTRDLLQPRHLLCAALFLMPIAAHGAAPKPCSLITQQQASAVFGAPVKAPLDTPIACIFSPTAASSGDTAVNMGLIAMDGAPAGMMAKVYPGTLHKDYATDKVETVPGLGEQNRVVVSDHKITIQVLYHEMILQFIVTNSGNPNLKSAMIQVAKQAVAKL